MYEYTIYNIGDVGIFFDEKKFNCMLLLNFMFILEKHIFQFVEGHPVDLQDRNLL